MGGTEVFPAGLKSRPTYDGAPLEFLPEFGGRRRALARAVASAGGEWVQTGGGFFALARFPGCENSFAAALRLLDTARVLTIPGELFGRAGEGFLRLSYGAASAGIEVSMPAGPALRTKSGWCTMDSVWR